jgi:hypothetical protein
MPTMTLAPLARQAFYDATGAPLAGGKLYTYLAGTTTPATTYQDAAGAVAHANPIVLDANGVAPAGIYLEQGVAYKFELRTASNVIIWTQDNVLAVPASTSGVDVSGIAGESIEVERVVYLSDGSGGTTAGRWYLASTANGYSSVLPQIGIALNSASAGQSVLVRVVGTVSITGPLTVGAAYYVGSSGGTLTSTLPASNQRVVGQALTATTLLVGDVQRLLAVLREAAGPQIITPAQVLVGGSTFSNDGGVTPRLQVGDTSATGAHRLAVVTQSGTGNNAELVLKSHRAIVQRMTGSNGRYLWHDLNVGEDRMYFDIDGSLTIPKQHHSMRARGASQSIPNATWTTLIIDTLDWAVGITHSSGVYTTPAYGVYVMVASVGWEANGIGLRGIRALRGINPFAGCIQGADNTAGQTVSVVFPFFTTGGDTWSVQVYQTSGGALNTAADTTLNRISIVKIA